MPNDSTPNSYVDALFNRIAGLSEVNSPDGWEKLPPVFVSGLTSLGFSRNSLLLLLISSQGRGLIDCVTGNKLARDRDDTFDWFDQYQLKCQGIDQAGSELFEIAGIFGGGLPLTNRFGDSITAIAQSWPCADLIFCSANNSILSENNCNSCVKLLRDRVIAYGFSWCGSYFVVGMSDIVYLWHRKRNHQD